MLSKHGGAIALHKTDLGDPEILRKAILTILNDERFESLYEYTGLLVLPRQQKNWPIC